MIFPCQWEPCICHYFKVLPFCFNSKVTERQNKCVDCDSDTEKWWVCVVECWWHQPTSMHQSTESFNLIIFLIMGCYPLSFYSLFLFLFSFCTTVTVPLGPHSSYCSPCSGTVCEHYHSEWPFYLGHLEDSGFPSARPVSTWILRWPPGRTSSGESLSGAGKPTDLESDWARPDVWLWERNYSPSVSPGVREKQQQNCTDGRMCGLRSSST